MNFWGARFLLLLCV